MTSLRKTKFLVALVNATSSHGYCSCPILSLESNLVFTDPSRGSEKIPTVEYPAVPPESICTSAAGFTRWTQGQCTRLPLRPPREERTKHETKPRRSLGKHAFFNGRVFVLLIAFVCSLFVFHC